MGNNGTVFPRALSVQTENGITGFFCLQHNTLLSHQHNFLYYYYYYGDSERQEYNIHRLCQVQQIMYMNS